MSTKYIIIGSSAAGIATINTIARLDKTADITCISNEEENPYNKCVIVDYLSGDKTQEQVYTLTKEFCKKKNINLLLGIAVTKILPQTKEILLQNGKKLQYDFLFIGTGASPIVPKVAGSENVSGVFAFHTLKNTNTLLSFIKQHKPKKAVVVGAGLSGLECLDGLMSHNIELCLVDMQKQVLYRQVDRRAAELIQNYMQQKNVSFYSNDLVSEVKSKDDKVTGVVLASGTILEADMVIFTVGSRPNSNLALDAKIALKGHSIFVDDHMRTSQEHIYAGGDAAMVKDYRTKEYVQSCTWPDAMQQGVVAAHAMVGKQKIYPGALSIVSSSFFDIKFISCGPVAKDDEKYEVIINSADNYYHKFLLYEDRLIGYLMVGQIKNLSALRRAYLTQEIISKEIFFS